MIVKSLLVGLISVVSAVSLAHAEVGLIGPHHLDSAKQLAGKKGEGDARMGGQKLPPESWLEKQDTLHATRDSNVLLIQLFSPRARATRFAAAAKRDSRPLNPNIWKLDMFNSGVALAAGALDEMSGVQVQDVICMIDGVVAEPLWVLPDSAEVIDRNGHRTMKRNIQLLLPLELFSPPQSMDVHVQTNRGPADVTFSADEISSLR